MKIGDAFRHEKWGLGVILDVILKRDRLVAKVRYGNAIDSTPIAEIPGGESLRLLVENRKPQGEINNTREQYIYSLKNKLFEQQLIDKSSIAEIIKTRRILQLTHFTRVENIEGIISSGILPRNLLKAGYYYNDEMRLDGFPEATSLSISFPNYQMFYRYRCLDSNNGKNWAVLIINPNILMNIPFLCFPTNAANRMFQDNSNNEIRVRSGSTGLNGMFHDTPAGARQSRNLPENYPTDPQAEILAFDPIAQNDIVSIHYMRKDVALESLVRTHLPNAKIIIGDDLFGARIDFKYWKANT